MRMIVSDLRAARAREFGTCESRLSHEPHSRTAGITRNLWLISWRRLRLLRHIREYQRALQQLRGTPPPPNGRASGVIMQKHISALRDAMKEFGACLGEIEVQASAVPNVSNQAAGRTKRDGTGGGS